MAHRGRVPLLLLSVLCVQFSRGLCFNLDTDDPVVKKGPEGSHFGYSVAQHQIMHHGIAVVRENVLIVGAPKSENPYQQWVALPGAVYKCRMTTNERDCRIVQVDTADIAEDRNRTGQFLGATVRSMGPGGKVMACAPKYRDVYTRGEVRVWERGRCYQLNQELVPDIHHSSQGIWNLCDDLPAGHSQYGYCHLGTALEFSHDGQDVMIAAPGAFHWSDVKPSRRPNLLTAPRQGTIDHRHSGRRLQPGSRAVWKTTSTRTLKRKTTLRKSPVKQVQIRIKKKKKQLDGVVTLDCMSGTARCFEFNCTLDTLLVNRSVVITVEARLWNTTFTQEYPLVSHVDILSHAEVELVKNFENMEQSRSFNDKATVVTKALPETRPVSLAEQVEVWTILLGLLLGLLLLLLIALCLWKCGFFRRVSVREQYEAKYYTATKIPRAKVIETNFSPSYYESSIYDASKYETSFQ
ncbi:PREDICTED: integrin alpha-7-like [Branchiostoma belcheri]|uniref:Integrin alpha-7-like n=1 Tax=Branchiostoma belcheri TaxID=7741 RepID=A0A6P4ZY25_BRABE|nr:PREDICTED: integrin alpha-7-like [Branchiostoma belcheri]